MAPQVYVRSEDPEFFDAIAWALRSRDPEHRGTATIGRDEFHYDIQFGMTARGPEWTGMRVSATGSLATLEDFAGAGRWPLFGRVGCADDLCL